MCNYGFSDCINQAKAYFNDWMQNGKEYKNFDINLKRKYIRFS